jgi:pimeloyl-CoA synthetase
MYDGTPAWAKWMVINQTIEQELELETHCRELKEHEDVATFAQQLLRTNWAQTQLIKNCVDRICELEAKLVSLEIKEERKERRLPIPLRFLFRRESQSS